MNIRKSLFTVRVTEHWHRLCKDVLNTSKEGEFKSHLNIVWGDWIYVAMLELDQKTSRSSFQPQNILQLEVDSRCTSKMLL